MALVLLLALALQVALPLQVQAALVKVAQAESLTSGAFKPDLVAVKFRPNLQGSDGNANYNYHQLRPDKYLGSPQFREFGLSDYVADRALPGLFYYSISAQTDMNALLSLLRADPQVQYAEPNYLMQATKTTNDFFYTKGRQYALSKINVEGAWDITTGGNIVVAVIDTGVRLNHLDLQGNIIKDRARTFLNNPVTGDFLEAVALRQGSPGTQGYNNAWDPEGHGTAVSGIIAAKTNNAAGMAGISWGALILPIQVLGATGGGTNIAVASGITYAADNKARIINLSLGGFSQSEVLSEAIRYAQNKGVIVVAAAGNETTGRPSYPAAYAGVIGVGATDKDDKVTSFSNFGADVSLVAPGSRIWTTYCNFLDPADSCAAPGKETLVCNSSNTNPDDPDACFVNGSEVYVYIDGTSFSAPIVVGILALMASVRPDITSELALKILQQSTDRPAGAAQTGRDAYYGFGRVNAARAVAQAAGQDVFISSKTLLQGLVQGVTLPDVIMSLDQGDRNLSQTKALDSNGGYRFENLGAATYYLRAVLPKQNRVLGPAIISSRGLSGEVIQVNFDFANNLVIAGPGAQAPGQGPGPQPAPNPPAQPNPPAPLLAPNSAYFTAIGPQPNTPDRYFFPEVGHTLSGTFKKYWDKNGGLAVFGYPISEEFPELSATDGKPYTVQYFQRNRFEYHPEFAETANEVLLGLLGSELTKGRDFAPGQSIATTANGIYFTQTRHTLTDRFYNYWRNSGGLTIFGYPISEPFQEGGLLVQYFERNRFEYHPENAGGKYEVLLGLLGIDLARSRNYMPSAPPRPSIESEVGVNLP